MIRAGSLPACSLSAAPRWWKRDALFELPLAHHAVAAVDDDHAHRRNQPCGKTAGIVLERPASFLRADEPAYTLALAVIVIHSHRKLLSLTHGPASSTQKQGGNGLPPYCCGTEAYCEFLRRLNAVRPAQVKLIQCRDVRHSRPVMEVFVAPGIGFGLWHSAPAAVGLIYQTQFAFLARHLPLVPLCAAHLQAKFAVATAQGSLQRGEANVSREGARWRVEPRGPARCNLSRTKCIILKAACCFRSIHTNRRAASYLSRRRNSSWS